MVSSTRIITDREIAVEVIRIIVRAQERVYLVSPFIGSELRGDLRHAIESALRKGVPCTLICGLKKNDKERMGVEPLREQGMTIHEVPKLHAKFYMNESLAILTSMNLSWWNREDLSQEVGIRLKSRQEIKALRQYAEKLMSQKAAAANADESNGQVNDEAAEQEKLGYCIRCGDDSHFYNSDQPLCEKCFAIWSTWGNRNYCERYCHACGREAATTKA